MRALLVFAILAVSLWGHAISVSTGELRVEGNRATYALRMPLYEAAHIRNPSRELFEHISFSSRGRAARATEQTCREETSDASYRCTSKYEFDAAPTAVQARCTFTAITVPNHVHVLKATKDGVDDQAVFDITFPEATLDFGTLESGGAILPQFGAGALRAIAGPAQLAFLAALVLAARTRRELFTLAACLIASQTAAAVIVPATAWHPRPGFVEAAAALAVAYLALEILAFAKAGQRWLVVLALGGLHGLYFALLLRTTGYSSAYVMSGAAVAQILVLGIFAPLWGYVQKAAARLHPVRTAASLLLAAGLGWFVIRVSG